MKSDSISDSVVCRALFIGSGIECIGDGYLSRWFAQVFGLDNSVDLRLLQYLKLEELDCLNMLRR